MKIHSIISYWILNLKFKIAVRMISCLLNCVPTNASSEMQGECSNSQRVASAGPSSRGVMADDSRHGRSSDSFRHRLRPSRMPWQQPVTLGKRNDAFLIDGTHSSGTVRDSHPVPWRGCTDASATVTSPPLALDGEKPFLTANILTFCFTTIIWCLFKPPFIRFLTIKILFLINFIQINF